MGFFGVASWTEDDAPFLSQVLFGFAFVTVNLLLPWRAHRYGRTDMERPVLPVLLQRGMNLSSFSNRKPSFRVASNIPQELDQFPDQRVTT